MTQHVGSFQRIKKGHVALCQYLFHSKKMETRGNPIVKENSGKKSSFISKKQLSVPISLRGVKGHFQSGACQSTHEKENI